MALACRPRLLIADEPTTALDVTIQARILDLLMKLRHENGMGLVLITHDMGVVAETADRVIVAVRRAAGRGERHARASSPIPMIPTPPRCWRLARARDRPSPAGRSGVVPGQFGRPRGCLFSPRCGSPSRRAARCTQRRAPELGSALCHTPLVRGVPQTYGLAEARL